MKQERPSTAGNMATAGLVGGRQFETFSKQHRERLAMGGSTGSSGPPKKGATKARITVVVRKRPLSQAEITRSEEDILGVLVGSKTSMKVEEPRKNMCGAPYVETHEFTFDRAYFEHHTNRHVYKSCVRQLVDALFTQGARCSCFAYGQTGSGKTYTMVGPGQLGATSSAPLHDQGLLELAARDCFYWLEQPEFDYNFGLYVSFFEIYCNKVYDLLGGRRLVKALETRTSDGVVVKDLTTVKVDRIEPLLKVIASGLEMRIVGSNSKNSDSSRGHAVLTLEVRNELTQSNYGKLAFIDLAGSERGADAMFSGKQTQTDGAGINRSLLALKECIRALDQQSSHVPFRDSELTKVLRDMFIGTNSRTLMISCVSPSSGCCEQTLNTLRYAERVKAIRRNCQPDVETSQSSDASEGSRSSRRRRRNRQEAQRKTKGQGARRQRSKQDSSSGSSDEGDRRSTTLSLGTSHDSDDISNGSGNDEECTDAEDQCSEDEPGSRQSARQEARTYVDMESGASPRVGQAMGPSRAVTGSRLSRAVPTSGCLSSRPARSPTSRDANKASPELRLAASCYDLPLTEQFGKPVSIASTGPGASRNSILSSSSPALRWPGTAGLSLDGRGRPDIVSSMDRPSSQQIVNSMSKRSTTSAPVSQYGIDDFRSLPKQTSTANPPIGRMPSGARNMITPLAPIAREANRSEISRIFPRPDADDKVAAANYLRKKYRELGLAVDLNPPAAAKHLDQSAATDLLNGILRRPPHELREFYDHYKERLRQTYGDLVKAHMDCLKAQTCSGLTQQKMLHELETARYRSKVGPGQHTVDAQYLESLRSTIENQLLLQLRLAKRVAEMERALAFQRLLLRSLQEQSLHIEQSAENAVGSPTSQGALLSHSRSRANTVDIGQGSVGNVASTRLPLTGAIPASLVPIHEDSSLLGRLRHLPSRSQSPSSSAGADSRISNLPLSRPVPLTLESTGRPATRELPGGQDSVGEKRVAAQRLRRARRANGENNRSEWNER